MKLLAWDTSSKSGALVALEWDEQSRAGWSGVRLVGETVLNVDVAHSERLLWAIDQLLEAAHWKIEDVGLFGVGVGPGSFTGLRIGMTTARTLAHTLGKPLIGVSSLAALARPAAQWLGVSGASAPVIVIAATDASKGELFSLWGAARSVRDCVAMADGDFPGLWKRGVEEQVLSPGQLMKEVIRKLKTVASEKSRSLKMQDSPKANRVHWIAVGEGRRRYPDAWAELPKSLELISSVPFPDQVQGRYLGQLVWEAYQAGLVREALSVHPRYLRASDAEMKLRAGILRPAPMLPAGER